jgi:ABC-type uncharacterized transport system involved in gliding motility auxiliary subunit
MEITPRSRLLARWNNILSIVLLLSLVATCAFLSRRYDYEADWTANGRHTLSDVSRALLGQLPGPVTITAFAPEDLELRDSIRDLVHMYQTAKSDIVLDFINPDAAPEQLRKLNISSIGELVVDYGSRSEHVTERSEEALSNALQRLLRGKEQWIAFLTGHGERDPMGNASHDLGLFAKQLQNHGFKTQTINLAGTAAIPDNTAVLVIASPEVPVLAGETVIINTFLERGGSLLWLMDPGPAQGLEHVAETLGLELPDGTIVDPATRQYGIEQPTMPIISNYGAQSALAGFKFVTLFPTARPVRVRAQHNDWHTEPLLTTNPQAWNETGPMKGTVKLDEQQDLKGPLSIGLSLTRTVNTSTGNDSKAEEHRQRVVVIGDGDFISDKYLGNSGNLELGLKVFNWLAGDDHLVSLPPKTSSDKSLELSERYGMMLWFGFQLLLPVLLTVVGLNVWLQRRNA